MQIKINKNYDEILDFYEYHIKQYEKDFDKVLDDYDWYYDDEDNADDYEDDEIMNLINNLGENNNTEDDDTDDYEDDDTDDYEDDDTDDHEDDGTDDYGNDDTDDERILIYDHSNKWAYALDFFIFLLSKGFVFIGEKKIDKNNSILIFENNTVGGKYENI